jgi:hypothetical protein
MCISLAILHYLMNPLFDYKECGQARGGVEVGVSTGTCHIAVARARAPAGAVVGAGARLPMVQMVFCDVSLKHQDYPRLWRGCGSNSSRTNTTHCQSDTQSKVLTPCN